MTTNKVQHGNEPPTTISAPPYSGPTILAPSLTEQYMQLANEFHTGQLAPIEPMPRPPPLPGAPIGLEYLTHLDQIIVNQKNCMQDQLNVGALPNRYTIVNPQGQLIYLATEESDGCQRQCCGRKRGFTIHLQDNEGKEVMKVGRDFKCYRAIPCLECCCCCCSVGCCSCIRTEIEIESAAGEVLGYVQESCKCGEGKFTVVDSAHHDIFVINGPRGCCGDVNNFKLKDGQYTIRVASGGGEKVGTLTKQYMGLTMAALTTKDRFVVDFPRDLDVKMKAVLISAVFIIDFMYFEHRR